MRKHAAGFRAGSPHTPGLSACPFSVKIKAVSGAGRFEVLVIANESGAALNDRVTGTGVTGRPAPVVADTGGGAIGGASVGTINGGTGVVLFKTSGVDV